MFSFFNGSIIDVYYYKPQVYGIVIHKFYRLYPTYS